MLVTNATTTYEPHAFDVAAREPPTDIVGLNYISRATMALQDNAREAANVLTWDQRCARYADTAPLHMCRRMLPDRDALDLSAALVNLSRWRSEQHTFRAAADTYGESVNLLAKLARRQADPWVWTASASAAAGLQCDVVQAETYPACIRTGRLWFDAPDAGGFVAGCYSGVSLLHSFWGEGVPSHWDYQRFKHEDPYCVRLSQEMYEKVLPKEAVAPSQAEAEVDDKAPKIARGVD